MSEPYLGQAPIECPTCGDHDWQQDQDYSATDRHYLSWQPQGTPQYHFTYELRSTSDENTAPWQCPNGHIGDDDIQEAIEATMSL